MPTDDAEGSELERAFETLWKQLGGAPLEREVTTLVPNRNFRCDFVSKAARVVIECEGGTKGRPVKCHNCHQTVRAMKKDGSPGGVVMQYGRHATGPGVISDVEKYNALALGTWKVFRITPDMLSPDPVKHLMPIIEFVDRHALPF